MAMRSPIVSVLGHVDHGKSSILDAIRGTNIVAGEAGAITQAIGASIIPASTLQKRAGKLLSRLGVDLTIPGLLFIDTPGHAAFTSLRKRGGNLADIAILVVDINEGFKQQTVEALHILRAAKTPFIIVANKLDLIPRFMPRKDMDLLSLINAQQEEVKTFIDQKLYEIVGKIHEEIGFGAERFDRVDDYTKQIAIIPTSAKAGFGLEELLMVVSGLSQRFLESSLDLEVSGPGRGVILEVKEERGLGATVDVILYDGTLRVGDTVVFGTLREPVTTKIRALFEPQPHAEMRDKKSKFKSVKEAVAATGVKVSAPGLDVAAAGMPFQAVTHEDEAEVKERLAKERQAVEQDTQKDGVLIKADTIGSLEAMITLLKDHGVPIRKALVGPITKKDIADATAQAESHAHFGAILGFNIPAIEGTDEVKVIVNDVIYRVLEDYDAWQLEVKEREEAASLQDLVRPCKVEVLQNCIFRQSNPCIIGVEVLKGMLRTGMPIMKENGVSLAIVKSLEAEKKHLQVAERGRQVAVSFPGVTFGRQLQELEFLYADISEDHFRKLKKLAKYLSPDEVETLKEVAHIKRKNNPVWGV